MRRATPSERGRSRLVELLEARGFEQSPRTDRLFYHPGLDGARVAFGTHVMRIEYRRDDGTWQLHQSFSLVQHVDRAADAVDTLVGPRTGLQELVAAEVNKILTTDRNGAFRIVESREQPGDYIQWIGSPGEGFRVEIADPGRNLMPPRPLTPQQLASIDRLGFSEAPDANFARTFEFSEESFAAIVAVIATAFADVFGLTEAHEVEVTGDNLDG